MGEDVKEGLRIALGQDFSPGVGEPPPWGPRIEEVHGADNMPQKVR